MDDKLFDEMAEVYDEMIDWKTRLERELPFIRQIFTGRKKLLELGSATGRHAIALSDEFSVIGVDINTRMTEIANMNAQKEESSAIFYQENSMNIKAGDSRFDGIDGIYLLANSLANLETEENIIQFLRNMRKLLPKGIMLGQTVILHDEINYLPIRNIPERDIIVQRIMFPSFEGPSSHELHFNTFQNGKYINQSVLPLYGITQKNLEYVCNQSGWEIREIYSSYTKDSVVNETGKALIWVLE